MHMCLGWSFVAGPFYVGLKCLLITQVPLKKTWLWFRMNLCDLPWQLAFVGLVQLKSNFSLCLHDPEKTHFLLLQVEDVQALPGFLLSLSCFLLLVSHLPGSRGMEWGRSLQPLYKQTSSGEWDHVFLSKSCSALSNSLRPHGLYSSPGQNIGVGSCSLIQGIFPTQGLNAGLHFSFTSWVTREVQVLGNLHCKESAHVPSTVEDSSDFLIFFRPENSKQVAVSWLLTQ